MNKITSILDEFEVIFKENSHWFFTEDDIVMYIYSLFSRNLDNSLFSKNNNLLLHKEYPTYFRCEMKDLSFIPIEEGEEVKARRGFFDLVILDEDFIDRYSYKEVKGQHISIFQDVVNEFEDNGRSHIFYGLEFLYKRDLVKTINQVETTIKLLIQDAKKIGYSKKEGHTKNVKSICYIKEITNEMKEKFVRLLDEAIQEVDYLYKEDIKVVFSEVL